MGRANPNNAFDSSEETTRRRRCDNKLCAFVVSSSWFCRLWCNTNSGRILCGSRSVIDNADDCVIDAAISRTPYTSSAGKRLINITKWQSSVVLVRSRITRTRSDYYYNYVLLNLTSFSRCWDVPWLRAIEKTSTMAHHAWFMIGCLRCGLWLARPSSSAIIIIFPCGGKNGGKLQTTSFTLVTFPCPDGQAIYCI